MFYDRRYGWARLAHVGTFLWLDYTGNLPRENGLEGLERRLNLGTLLTSLRSNIDRQAIICQRNLLFRSKMPFSVGVSLRYSRS